MQTDAENRLKEVYKQLAFEVGPGFYPIQKYRSLPNLAQVSWLGIFQEINCPKNSRKILKQLQKIPLVTTWVVGINYFSGVA